MVVVWRARQFVNMAIKARGVFKINVCAGGRSGVLYRQRAISGRGLVCSEGEEHREDVLLMERSSENDTYSNLEAAKVAT